MNDASRTRRVPWVGITVTLLIILAILAFAIFKRKGSRIPPPPGDTVSVRYAAPPYTV